jgi:ribonuclease G
MTTSILVNRTGSEVRVAVVEDGQCTSFQLERDWERSVVGNVYKGRVVRVLPGMQSAFVEVGLERAVFLHASDVLAGDSPGHERPAGRDGFEPLPPPGRARGADPDVEDTDPGLRLAGAEVAPTFLPEAIALPALEHGLLAADGATVADEGPIVLADGFDDRLMLEGTAADSASPAGGRGQPPEARAARQPRPKLRIEDALRQGQEVVVQVTKEPLGTKGARVTMNLSLPGRLLVYLPGHGHVGVSRRVRGKAERDRLRQVLDELRQPEEGFIARTACEGASREDLAADIDWLREAAATIRERRERLSAPALLHEDLDLPRRAARDLLRESVAELIVDDRADWERIRAFVDRFLPAMAPRLRLWDRDEPIFEPWSVEKQLERALERRVPLPSGAYLIVDTTEALTAIDVNTGRFVGSQDLEDTALRTNLEAVLPIVRELRLRDLGGLIVIDFIDMENPNHRRQVQDALVLALAQDSARNSVLPISELGLVEMTRRRVREDLDHNLTTACQCCDGRGRAKSSETIVYEILRVLERHRAPPADHEVLVRVSPGVYAAFQRHEARGIPELSHRRGFAMRLVTDGGLLRHRYVLDVVPRHRPRPEGRG